MNLDWPQKMAEVLWGLRYLPEAPKKCRSLNGRHKQMSMLVVGKRTAINHVCQSQMVVWKSTEPFKALHGLQNLTLVTSKP